MELQRKGADGQWHDVELPACESEDPGHPGLTCHLAGEHDAHYALGYTWRDTCTSCGRETAGLWPVGLGQQVCDACWDAGMDLLVQQVGTVLAAVRS